MKKRSQRATITDVAKKAGVSVTTVSRAINSKGLVNGDTYSRILDAMYQLGYPIPDDANIPAVKKGKRTIIVNTPTAAHAYYHDVFQGITEAANRYDWSVMLNEEYISESNGDYFSALLTNCNAAGLITTNSACQRTLEKLAKKIPVVQCCALISPDLPFVGHDEKKAASIVANYLLSTGKKRIAIITSTDSLYDQETDCINLNLPQRVEYLKQALEEGGISIDPGYIIDMHDSLYYSYAYNTISNFLKRGNRPDAIFGVVDTVAYAAVMALLDQGFRVPEDCIVIGFDNIAISEMCRPPLSTVAVPRFEIGFNACNMLHSVYTDPDYNNTKMYLNVELILRGTT